MCSYQHRLAPAQSIPLLAIVMALSAFSIDTMLPALSTIAQELGAHHPNDAQLVIVMMFVGFSAGQLLYGPLSDIIGRKRALYLGISVFIVGCTISYQAANFQAMLVGRFLQGLGVSSARIVSLAIVRDQYVGADMAKIMSMIMGRIHHCASISSQPGTIGAELGGLSGNLLTTSHTRHNSCCLVRPSPTGDTNYRESKSI